MGDMTLGNPDAPVTLIEYASMTCSHCANFNEFTFQKLKENYIDTGKIFYVFREFPLDRYALEASLMARCAGEDKYFEIVDRLFREQRTWITQQNISAAIRAIGRDYGVDSKKYDACQSDEKLLARIGAKVTEAQKRYGVRGTPAIIINGKLLEAGPSYPNVAAAIDDAMPE
jgi:protein-disulfide isomerase